MSALGSWGERKETEKDEKNGQRSWTKLREYVEDAVKDNHKKAVLAGNSAVW